MNSSKPPQQQRPGLKKGVLGGLSVASAATYNFLAHDFEYVPDRYHDDKFFPTRLSRVGSDIRLGQARGPNNYPLRPPPVRKRTWQRDVNGEARNKPFVESQYGNQIDDQEQSGRNPFDDANEVEDQPNETGNEEPYHVFPKRHKWAVIVIIGTAGLFSGLSSNIYNPSLDAIARDLKVNSSQVSLTITSYLVMQAVSPLLWGPMSDTLGRRPTYIASFLVYIAANVALSFSPNYAVLLIFRGIQAAGSASTVSIGNGVIQDISPTSERGAFISFYQAIRNFSTAIGPVLGGALANSLGFRSVFVFLLIVSSLILIAIVAFLPETMRSIAGNGSLRLTGPTYKPLIRYVTKEPSYMQDPDGPLNRKNITVWTFLTPFKLFKEKDLLINLIWGGFIYAIWNMVTTSTTPVFKARFPFLNELLLGVAFLPNGFGTIVGSVLAGKLLTRDYKVIATNYKATHNMKKDDELSAKDIPPDFPLEKVRLQRLPWIVALFTASVTGYGFSLAYPTATSRPGWIALPLVLQFLIAASANAIFALNQTIISDLCPGQGASATAVNNLVRCGLAALGVAFAEQMINAVGPGTAFLVLAMVVIAISPIQVINQYWGPKWRAERLKKRGLKASTTEEDRQKA